MKKYTGLFLVLCMLCGLLACAPSAEMKTTAQTVSGGQTQQDTNLKNVTVAQTQEMVVVAFDFVSGDEQAGVEETPMQGVPKYHVSFCEDPMRLVLRVEGVRHWAYQVNSTIQDPTGLVQGMLRVLPVGGRSTTDFYLNLSQKVKFRVEESNGSIKVYLKPENSLARPAYFVVGDFFAEYQEGILPEEAELTPTLASDGVSVLMISNAFFAREDAEVFKQDLEERYGAVFGGRSLRIVENDALALPSFEDGQTVDELQNKVVFRTESGDGKAELFCADGRVMCEMNAGDQTLIARSEIVQGRTENSGDRLYLQDRTGKRRLLFDYELSVVAGAVFSPDDSKLLILEQTEENQICSIYDMASKKLSMLDEALIGSNVAGCAWSSDSSSLYLLSGDDDFSVLNYRLDNGQITVLRTELSIDGSLYRVEDALYYMDVVEDETAVIRHPISGSEIDSVPCGEFFVMSTNGNILTQVYFGEEEEECGELKLISFDGKEQTVVKQQYLLQYFFSADGKSVFYVVENADELFVNTVYRFDIEQGTTQRLFDTVDGSFLALADETALILNITYEKENTLYSAAYRIPLK